MNCLSPPPCPLVTPIAAGFQLSKSYGLTPVEKMDAVCVYVSRKTGVSIRQLFEKTRKRHIVLPRQIALYLLCRWNICTLTQIAEYFNGIDHTTVIHSRNAVADQIKYSQGLDWVSSLEAKGFLSVLS